MAESEMTFEEWVDENIKYIRTPDIFQWLFEAWESGAKAEREACAKVADGELMNTNMLTSYPPKSSAAWNIAAAIRARGSSE